MPEDRSQKIGELGELALATWAGQVYLTSTRPGKDKHGWDFLLEAHLPNLDANPLRASYDKRSYPAKFWIQVKTTDDKPGSWQVKLDNWERLVKTPYPAFFLICEFDGAEICQRAYLVHVDEGYIHKVIKRLREATLEPGVKLHKTTITFSYDESYLLPSLDGLGLLAALNSHTGNSIEEYSAWKMQLVETVGYENGGYLTDITFPIPADRASDPMGYWIDLCLGLIPSLDIDSLKIRDVRFDIEVPALAQTHQGGRMEVSLTPAGKAMLIFSAEAPHRLLRVVADVYTVPRMPGEIAPDYRKLRFAADLIELVTTVRDGRFDGKLKFRFPDPHEPHKLYSLYSVASLCLIFFESFQNGASVTSELWSESQRFATSQIDPAQFAGLFNEDNIRLCRAIISAVSIAKHLDLPLDTQVKIAELAKQMEGLQLQADLLAGRNGSHLQVSFQVEGIDRDLPTCIPLLIHTLIGEHKVIVAVNMFGYPEVVDSSANRLQLTTDKPVYERSWIDTRTGAPNQAVKTMLQSIRDKYVNSHNVVIMAEYQTLLDAK
jgi:hypothetical protein